MDSDETTNVSSQEPDDAGELVSGVSEPTETPANGADDPASSRGLGRRRFLTAAALGTAAAVAVGKGSDGLRFGPSIALANDLSDLPCTAQDVTVDGVGIVVNEPCACNGTGTFNAQVDFIVNNHTSTGRYCVALHLVAASVGGVTIPAQDVILRRVGTNSSTANPGTNFMRGTIAGFPCNATGLVCFGSAGVTRGKCAPGTCTTLAWTTTPNAAGCTTADQSPPGGQCRHQQVCVQGFGVSLACTAGCATTCGGQATLTATANVATPVTGNPLTYTLTATSGVLKNAQGQVVPNIVVGPTNNTTASFQVTVDQNTTYQVQLCDTRKGANCCRTATTSLNANPISKPTITAGTVACNGDVTLTASPSGLASYTWFDGATQIGTGNPLNTNLSAGSHSITVRVTNSAGCQATSDPVNVTRNQPVVTTLPSAVPGACAQQSSSNIVFTASASGGTGSGYTFVWKLDGNTVQTGASNTYNYAPNLDCAAHTVSVTASDGAGCAGNAASRTVTQSVTTQIS